MRSNCTLKKVNSVPIRIGIEHCCIHLCHLRNFLSDFVPFVKLSEQFEIKSPLDTIERKTTEDNLDEIARK